jgi:tetratricopeptide (TPR) repeat protein
MPLGIELAAAWLKTVPSWKIVDEIEHNIDFLATSMRNIPERHRSIRAVIDISWQLLNEDERDVFMKLSVFRGGFMQEAAEVVADATLFVLSSLVDKSILRISPLGRYRFHERIGQFAEAKLEASSGETKNIQDFHCDYYAEYLSRYQQDSRGPRQALAYVELKQEIENVRAAWNYAIENGKLGAIRKSIRGLLYFFLNNNWFLQGIDVYERAIEMLRRGEPTGERGVILGMLLAVQGDLYNEIDENEKSLQLSQESLELLEQLDARSEMWLPLLDIGTCSVTLGTLKDAKQLLQDSIDVAMEFDNHAEAAVSLVWLADVNRVSGNFEEAERQLLESLEVFRRIGDRWLSFWTRCHMSRVALEQGRYTHAVNVLKPYVDYLAIFSDTRHGKLISRKTFGDVKYALGDYEGAKRCYEEGHEASGQTDSLSFRYHYLVGLANIAHPKGDNENAELLYQECLTLAEEVIAWGMFPLDFVDLGSISYRLGDHDKASKHYQNDLEISREKGWRRKTANALNGLGRVSLEKGNDLEARTHFHEALEISLEIGALPLVLETLVGVAELFVRDDQLEHAVEILYLCVHHSATHAAVRMRAEKLLNDLKAKLPQDEFVSAQQRGIASDLESVVTALLTKLSREGEVLSEGIPVRIIDTPLVESLSERECEVLRLISEGLSNR